MYGLETIEAMNEEATKRAKVQRTKLYIATADNDKGVFSCPVIGDYVPKGWTKTAEYFVDSSGLGSEGESALTASQFLSRVKKGRGYGITERGQFQVFVAEFKEV